MPTHKAVHVAAADEPLTLVDVDTEAPPAGHVRIAVAACGVCGTDREFVNGGHFPGLQWPITLGHEIAGTVAEIGDGVEDFAVGDRVAVGWFGGNCNRCIPCRRGYFMQCERLQVPSWQYPGGYAESVTAPGHRAGAHPGRAVVRRGRTDGLRGRDDVQRAAPDARQGRRPGRGPRHRRAGSPRCAVVAGRWASRPSRSPGAPGRPTTPRNWAHTTTSTRRAQDVAAELKKLGGAAVVLATAANAAAMAATVGGLGPAGRTGRHRRHRREPADQPARPDQLRACR